ncbi:phage tail protein [Sphingomonas sp. MMS24-J45]|uniref:phage tail protein n=1 Tax=Sphingomonas sp. MMS24-J45 TaxID=3238806 RepID=UPI00384C23EE
MSQNFVGEIRMFGGNFAPRDWMFCNGQLLSIAQYQTLYVLIGTTYGGDGITTFALPDLRSRLAIGEGSGPGLTPRQIGQSGGTENVTLTQAQIPSHNHMVIATTVSGNLTGPSNTAVLAAPGGTGSSLYVVPGATPVTTVPLDPTSVGTAGQSQQHSNLMPSVCVSFIIALNGIFPSRN